MKFCNPECQYLSPSEAEQDTMSIKSIHMCGQYGKQVKHGPFHPNIMRLAECENTQPMLMPFLLEIWEKKTITVTAGNYAGAVKQVPKDCTFESVRKQGDTYEDRLTEYDWCPLCCHPMLQDKNGPVDRWAKIEFDRPDDYPFAGDCVHESCAISQDRKILEAMKA